MLVYLFNLFRLHFGRLAESTGLCTLLASIVVTLTLALRQRFYRKAGAMFIILYGLSYAVLHP